MRTLHMRQRIEAEGDLDAFRDLPPHIKELLRQLPCNDNAENPHSCAFVDLDEKMITIHSRHHPPSKPRGRSTTLTYAEAEKFSPINLARFLIELFGDIFK